MTTAADLARQLQAKRTGAGAWMARCPAHDDKTASLSIGAGEDGRLLLRCFAGCDFADILKAAGVEPSKPNGEARERPGKARIVATYDYRAVHGELVFQVVRKEPKTFLQRRPDGNGGWIWNMKGVEMLPYNLPAVVNANEVFVCEGEKDCDNLSRLGLVATTNAGGANSKWPKAFNGWFDGRHVTIIPDNDDAGRKHARDIAATLHGTAASIRILELPGLPPKGDVSNWLAAGGKPDELRELAAAAPYWDGETEVDGEDIAEPEPARATYTLLADLKPNLRSDEIVQGLIRRRAFGEVHAEASGGKTAIIVDMLLHVAAGIEYRRRRVERQPVVYVALEGHGGIANRIIAAAKEIGVTDAPFALVTSSDNFRDAAAAERVAVMCKELMARFGGDCPVVAIDTYTAALAGGSDCDPKDVGAFIANVQRHLLTNATVLLCHHFGKDQSRGGRGWSGLNAALDFELEIERDGDLRTMRVTKSRDGSDQQAACCYRLVGREIGTNEHGEPVTAVVVEHLADEDVTKRSRRLSPKARAALNILWAMIKDRSKSFPLPDGAGLRCVLLSAWETACCEAGAISDCKQERDRRLKFRAAMDELQEANAIVADGETEQRVYPAPTGAATDRDGNGR